MRTKQSNTAHHPSHCVESVALRTLPRRAAAPTTLEPDAGPASEGGKNPTWWRLNAPALEFAGEAVASSTAEEDEGLLHDAGNLIGAVGLYCDLLSVPQVLRPEHRHYADELRLLGERSAALIERLMERRAAAGRTSSLAGQVRGPAELGASGGGALRTAVERCVGVLRRIAQEQRLEVTYGEAAALPVRVPAESVERILINLVRNAAAARVGKRGAIRIGVGLLSGETEGVTRPWPFQRVLLAVEDDGLGMGPDEVAHLLADEPVAARHGIGFRVVRELVKASGGELAITSEAGRGTRIEMEWPVAQPIGHGPANGEGWPRTGERRRAAWRS